MIPNTSRRGVISNNRQLGRRTRQPRASGLVQQAAGSRPQQSELVYVPSADAADAVMVWGLECLASDAVGVVCKLAGANKMIRF